MTAMDWDLALKVFLGIASIVWTFIKIVNEYKILKDKPKPPTEDPNK